MAVTDSEGILQQVRRAAEKRILFLPHALNQMNAPERMISSREVREVVFHGILVEDYPEDARGQSCLLLGYGEDQRPVHVVCSPKVDYLAVITAYVPSLEKWRSDWRTRREK